MLIGNLTRDPVIRESSSGVTVCTFGVATNTTWKDTNGQTQERAEFHNIVAFNKLAEICAQVLASGMLIYIEGELRTRVKERTGGDKYYKTEVKLNDMLLLNSKDRTPVGIDAAKDAGSELVQRLGDGNPVPDADPEDTSVPAPEEETSAEDFDSKDLF